VAFLVAGRLLWRSTNHVRAASGSRRCTWEGALAKRQRARQATGQTKKEPAFFLAYAVHKLVRPGWTALIASIIGMGLGTIRFLFPNVLSEPSSKFRAGLANQYEQKSVSTRYKEGQHTWIGLHKSDDHGDILYALDATCTHLGCTPNWLEREQKFKCPCHGSGFHISGVNYDVPTPRPLERMAIGIGDDGLIVVDKSKHFRKELDQWADPASFIKV
jgi:cytochrome b6-f complex iron-sulfur subunit